MLVSGTVHTGGESLQSGLGDVQTLWNYLNFSLCAMLSVCYVVTASDGKRSLDRSEC